jgi:hypothetical protein
MWRNARVQSLAGQIAESGRQFLRIGKQVAENGFVAQPFQRCLKGSGQDSRPA